MQHRYRFKVFVHYVWGWRVSANFELFFFFLAWWQQAADHFSSSINLSAKCTKCKILMISQEWKFFEQEHVTNRSMSLTVQLPVLQKSMYANKHCIINVVLLFYNTKTKILDLKKQTNRIQVPNVNPKLLAVTFILSKKGLLIRLEKILYFPCSKLQASQISYNFYVFLCTEGKISLKIQKFPFKYWRLCGISFSNPPVFLLWTLNQYLCVQNH